MCTAAVSIGFGREAATNLKRFCSDDGAVDNVSRHTKKNSLVSKNCAHMLPDLDSFKSVADPGGFVGFERTPLPDAYVEMVDLDSEDYKIFRGLYWKNARKLTYAHLYF
jgi:hypothetical protein